MMTPIAATEVVSIESEERSSLCIPAIPYFVGLIKDRYAGFLGNSLSSDFAFDIDLYEPSESSLADANLEVKVESGEWVLKRGDFTARWHPDTRHGYIRQSYSPYAIDCVLRIVHSLILARQGGFLVHAASAICGERAFLFSGVSGAGKTTISRLAPPDATLLTDEISYVRREGNRYLGYGHLLPVNWHASGKTGARRSAPSFSWRKAYRTRSSQSLQLKPSSGCSGTSCLLPTIQNW